MDLRPYLEPGVAAAALLLVGPMLAFAFFPEAMEKLGRRLPRIARITLPALLSVPYALAAGARGMFRWEWMAAYALIPAAIAALLEQAHRASPGRRGTWLDFAVLLALGLAVDLGWLEPAWPKGLAPLGKILLLDAGIFGFAVVRDLQGVGFDLRIRRSDLVRGIREFVFFAVIAVPLGLWLGFLHLHRALPPPAGAILGFLFTFLFIAIPEELYFRGWIQNLLEGRLGRFRGLLVTSALFGLSHWNKRALHFNWRYVLIAAIAGIFYGRAWRSQRRIAASALTHASVDTVWSIWLR